jgi:hypothetical protein
LSVRCTILPDPRFEELKSALAQRLSRVGASVGPDNFASLLDPLMRQVIARGFAEAHAHEGTVWLMDAAGENLVPAFNTGPAAEKLVGRFQQPLSAGLISMVFATEQPFVENDVAQNAQHSKRLDTLLQVETHALIAVPFCFLKGCRGVISCVQLKPPGANATQLSGFTPAGLESVQRASELLSRLLEFRLLSSTVGSTPA